MQTMTATDILEAQTTLWGQISTRVKIELGAWGRTKITFDTARPRIMMKTTNLSGLIILVEYMPGTDTYTVETAKMRSSVLKVRDTFTGVYADQLNELLIGFATKYAR